MEKDKKSFRLSRYTDNIILQALRYGLAAALGFLADYGALALLTGVWNLHYLVAVPIAFVLGIAVNYIVGVLVVFRRGRRERGAELGLFLVISLMALGLTELTMYLFSGIANLHPLISRILSGAITYLFNFLMRRFVLYGKQPPKEDRSANSPRDGR